jgi:hypothetical protein
VRVKVAKKMITTAKGQGIFKAPQIGRNAEAKDPTVYLEELAKEFKQSGLARAFAEGIRNERLTQNVGIGSSMLLSTRRKPIDSAFTRARDKNSSWKGGNLNNVQLSLEADDDLNLWLLDTIRLVGALGDERNWRIAAQASSLPIDMPYLVSGGLSEDEMKEVVDASVDNMIVDNDSVLSWTYRLKGHEIPGGMTPSLEPASQVDSDSKNDVTMLNARNAINTDFLPDPVQVNAILGGDQDAIVARRLGLPLIQGDPMITGSDTPRGGGGESKEEKDGKASVPSRGQSRRGQDGKRNTDANGRVTDYFFPSENQRNKAAEAKLLKDKEAGSHPAVVFARQYYLNYDKTALQERQALPMQRELDKTRTAPSQFPNPKDRELVSLLLERDMLEADRALDPFSDVLLERLREDVMPRWARIRLV